MLVLNRLFGFFLIVRIKQVVFFFQNVPLVFLEKNVLTNVTPHAEGVTLQAVCVTGGAMLVGRENTAKKVIIFFRHLLPRHFVMKNM
mgnify:CR=1 FL=1